MLTTLKELCDTFPKVAQKQSPLDNVAATMFNPDSGMPYIQSKQEPQERYGIPVDQESAKHYNDVVPGFVEFGPNEKYLVNKIMYSPRNLLYIVGGVGVGKTRFVKHLLTEILPSLTIVNAGYQKYGPCPIYYDFLDEGNILPTYDDSNSIKSAFLDSFCDRIEAELLAHRFFDLEKEVGEIWDNLISDSVNSFRKNSALNFIISQLRLEEAERENLEKDYQTAINRRKTIRQKIMSDATRRIAYLGLLVKYVRNHYFDSSPTALLIIVDNVDREPSLVQQQVKLIVKPFANVCGGRTIITARQSTYYQQFDDGSSDPVDAVAYCGPGPLDILKARVDAFLDRYQEYHNFYDPESLPSLANGVRHVSAISFNNDSFQTLFTSLCGRSVRKSLLLAQRLINNSVYDPGRFHNPFHSSTITIGEVLRALVVGTDDIFRTSPNNLIDNLFTVESKPGGSYLLKPRILKLLTTCGKNGLTVTRLVDAISGFGHSIDAICDAVNELLNTQKRLIWSDAVRDGFPSEKDLVKYGPTRLYISTAGQGYVEQLCCNIDYVQEIMLDTLVEARDFGTGWRYDQMEDRFELLRMFTVMLSKVDMEETEYFVSTRGDRVYVEYFGASQLMSQKLLTEVKARVERILNRVEDNSRVHKRKLQIQEFRKKQRELYEDRLLMLKNAGDILFENGQL